MENDMAKSNLIFPAQLQRPAFPPYNIISPFLVVLLSQLNKRIIYLDKESKGLDSTIILYDSTE